MAQKIPNWVYLAALAGVGYAAYKSWDKISDFLDTLKKGAGLITAPVTDAISNAVIAYDPYLSQPTVQSTLTGSVLFPNGAQVPLTNLQVMASGTGNAFRALVTYQGKTYQLQPHDANGNYPAVPT